jgi:methyl-accepting chemotaxis protein
MTISNLRIAHRMAAAFALVLGLMVLIAITGIVGLEKLDAGTNSIALDKYPKTRLVNEVAYMMMDNARIARNIILVPDDSARSTNKQAFDKNAGKIQENLASLEKMEDSERGQTLLRAVKDARTAYKSYISDVIELGMAHKRDEATTKLGSV